MHLPGVSAPGLYIRDGRLYVAYRNFFGKLCYFHVAYVNEAGDVEYKRPNENICVKIGTVSGKRVELYLYSTDNLGLASSNKIT